MQDYVAEISPRSSVGEPRDGTYFIHRGNPKYRWFSRRSLVDPHRRWDRPDEHVDEGICHHLIRYLSLISANKQCGILEGANTLFRTGGALPALVYTGGVLSLRSQLSSVPDNTFIDNPRELLVVDNSVGRLSTASSSKDMKRVWAVRRMK
jgi:hypothetical protein